MPSSLMTSLTSGCTRSPGAVPAEILLTVCGSAKAFSQAHAICERPAFCTQAKSMVFGGFCTFACAMRRCIHNAADPLNSPRTGQSGDATPAEASDRRQDEDRLGTHLPKCPVPRIAPVSASGMRPAPPPCSPVLANADRTNRELEQSNSRQSRSGLEGWQQRRLS